MKVIGDFPHHVRDVGLDAYFITVCFFRNLILIVSNSTLISFIKEWWKAFGGRLLL